MVHFGAYGYLEFRPGKGVGLSVECWPEISIDEVPHFYVYIVSNPSDGMVAKRRSYAVLVDHLHPPVTMAETLDDLEDLLNQYARANQLGEHARTKVIYEKLIEIAKMHYISVPSPENCEETIENIRRYVDMVRGSQVNMGLHIFGSPPKEPRKLAEYVAAAMSYDSYNSPSIKRAIATYLDLDYEELRKAPMRVNERYGVPNREVLQKIHLIAVNVLEKIILLNSTEPNIIAKLVEEEAKRIG